MMSSFVNRIRHRNLLVYTIAGILVIAAFAIGLTVGHGSASANKDVSAGDQAAGNHGGNSGNPGASRSERPAGQCAASQSFTHRSTTMARRAVTRAAGLGCRPTEHQALISRTILPGLFFRPGHILMLPTSSSRIPSIICCQAYISAICRQIKMMPLSAVSPTVSPPSCLVTTLSRYWAIDSNSSIGNQAGVTVEYLTVEKYLSGGNSGAINPDSNTGWTIQYNTITLNVPGAGVVLGADNVLKDNCMTLNGQYGFQSVAVNAWGMDQLTGGPYNVTVEGNEISYNDTCDFEGLLDNPSIGWSKHNPVPAQYRNSHCGPVVPDGDQGGFKLWQTDGVTIKDNYIHNNWGPAPPGPTRTMRIPPTPATRSQITTPGRSSRRSPIISPLRTIISRTTAGRADCPTRISRQRLSISARAAATRPSVGYLVARRRRVLISLHIPASLL